MDETYLTRLALRKQIIQDHRHIVLQCHPGAKSAVDELYTYITYIYLPRRYPTMFALSPATHNLQNLVTGDKIPLKPSADPIQSLKTLGENIDEEFTLMLPSPDGDGYSLQAYILCFPSGFNTLQKFGMKLKEIHKPVPGYREKLEKSMDRYFDSLPAGKIVKRANWAITTNHNLFSPSGNHAYANEDVVGDEEVDIEGTFLRSERQMLWRLPSTGALVFSFHTYLVGLNEVKEEGLGEELAQAIDGLKNGSVPQMHFYKRGAVWGEAVKSFLRR